MAEHELIRAQRQTLSAQLPAPLAAEIVDGLEETYQAKLQAYPPTEAARAAIAEFGDASTIIHAVWHTSTWRRTTTLLLGTGPILGCVWAAALITQRAWLWPLPALSAPLWGATLLTAVALLLIARCERQRYRRPRRQVIAAGTLLMLLDLSTGVALLTFTTVGWLTGLAVAGSLIRLLGLATTARHILDTRPA